MVQTDAQLTQREMADRVGLSLGGLNYCLKALVAKGWIKVQNFSHSRNKLGYVYLLTPAGITAKASLTHQFLRRKMEEYEALRREIAELRSETGTSMREERE